MEPKNLWGNLPSGEEAGRSPKTILREQAEALTEGTGRILMGKVETTAEHSEMTHELSMVARFLSNYEVGIVRATHKAMTYPVKVYDLVGETYSLGECQTDQEFELKLAQIFTSKKVRLIITSLLSQSPPQPSRPI